MSFMEMIYRKSKSLSLPCNACYLPSEAQASPYITREKVVCVAMSGLGLKTDEFFPRSSTGSLYPRQSRSFSIP